MPKSGCPGANGFQWQTGYIYQDLEDEGNVTTVSPNSQLKCRVSGDVERYFCIKDNIQQQSKEIEPNGLRGSIASIRKVLIVQMDCRVGLYYGMTKMVLAEQTKTPMPAFFQKEYLITTQRYSFAVRPPVTDIKSQ